MDEMHKTVGCDAHRMSLVYYIFDLSVIYSLSANMDSVDRSEYNIFFLKYLF